MAQAKLSAKFKLYYRLRPFIPIPLRQLLQRERNQRIDVPKGWYFPSEFLNAFRVAIEKSNSHEVIHPWPDEYQFSVVLTHDVETEEGVKLVMIWLHLRKSMAFVPLGISSLTNTKQTPA